MRINNNFEQRIYDLIIHSINDLGYNVVKITCAGVNANLLEILIERNDELPVDVSDCRKVSKHVSAILDIEDIMHDKFNLEVSSAGIERPLVSQKDYERFVGKEILLKLRQALDDCKKFQGILERVEDDRILLKLKKRDQLLVVNWENIKSANLVFTDEMFRNMLKK